MLIAILMITLLSGLSGCGKLGTAVVLWPPEDSIWETGDLVTVHDESLLRKTYIVNLPNQRRMKEEIDQWRLRLFRGVNEASTWAASMMDWRNVYAECLYQGLPMREEPNNLSSQVYRFRQGDLIKILSQEPGPVQVGNLKGYWYKVLAFGGMEGYVFDYYLNVMRFDENGREIINTKEAEDARLNSFLTSLWHPKYFNDMIAKGNINLRLFRPEYGLFIDTEAQSISLNLPNKTLTEVWTDIIPLSADRYDFHGSSFRVTINNENFVSIQYNINGVEYFDGFERLSVNISDIIRNEINRQNLVLAKLMENGPSYGSRTYGNLEILEKGQFVWSTKSSLISQGLLTINAGNTGSIVLGLFLSAELSSRYEGAISFRFENGETLPFLYSFEGRDLRLLYVRENAIEKEVIHTDQFLNPVHIFFKKIDLNNLESVHSIAIP